MRLMRNGVAYSNVELVKPGSDRSILLSIILFTLSISFSCIFAQSQREDCAVWEDVYNQSGVAVPWPIGECCGYRDTSSYSRSIICDLNNRTMFVTLPAAGLKGQLPSLASQTSLQALYLSNNNLTGPIPDLPYLPKPLIYLLGLDGNSFTGSIPATLANQKALITLTLSKNRLTGTVPDLSNLTGLASLTLFDNLLSGNVDGRVPQGLVTCILYIPGTNDGNKDLYSCAPNNLPRACLFSGNLNAFGPDCPSTVVTTTTTTVATTPTVGPSVTDASLSSVKTTPTGTTTPPPPGLDSPPNTALIAGATVGGFVGLVAIVCFVLWYVRKRGSKSPGPLEKDIDGRGTYAPVSLSSGLGGGSSRNKWLFLHLATPLGLPDASYVDCNMEAMAITEFPAPNPDELPLLPSTPVTLVRVFRDGWGLARLRSLPPSNQPSHIEGVVPLECLDVGRYGVQSGSVRTGSGGLSPSAHGYGDRWESRGWSLNTQSQSTLTPPFSVPFDFDVRGPGTPASTSYYPVPSTQTSTQISSGGTNLQPTDSYAPVSHVPSGPPQFSLPFDSRTEYERSSRTMVGDVSGSVGNTGSGGVKARPRVSSRSALDTPSSRNMASTFGVSGVSGEPDLRTGGI
ncbi:hypothetical protein HDU93_001439 [Gonapodya sp. JEL0774]|nr:hypothetical protein HDU93_001439 [Gonapodya sp. JEL0774]